MPAEPVSALIIGPPKTKKQSRKRLNLRSFANGVVNRPFIKKRKNSTFSLWLNVLCKPYRIHFLKMNNFPDKKNKIKKNQIVLIILVVFLCIPIFSYYKFIKVTNLMSCSSGLDVSKDYCRSINGYFFNKQLFKVITTQRFWDGKYDKMVKPKYYFYKGKPFLVYQKYYKLTLDEESKLVGSGLYYFKNDKLKKLFERWRNFDKNEFGKIEENTLDDNKTLNFFLTGDGGENITSADLSKSPVTSVNINPLGMAQTIIDLEKKYNEETIFSGNSLTLPLLDVFHESPFKIAEKLGFFDSEKNESPIVFKDGTLSISGDEGIFYTYPDGKILILMRPDGILDETYTELIDSQIFKTACSSSPLIIRPVSIENNNLYAGQTNVNILKFKIVACMDISIELVEIKSEPEDGISDMYNMRLYNGDDLLFKDKENILVYRNRIIDFNFSLNKVVLSSGQSTIFTVNSDILDNAKDRNVKLGVNFIGFDGLSSIYTPGILFSEPIKIISFGK